MQGVLIKGSELIGSGGTGLIAGSRLVEGPELIEAIVKWIVENVDESVVSANGLVYNLVHLARDGEDYRPYYYEPEQDEEIARKFDIDQ